MPILRYPPPRLTAQQISYLNRCKDICKWLAEVGPQNNDAIAAKFDLQPTTVISYMRHGLKAKITNFNRTNRTWECMPEWASEAAPVEDEIEHPRDLTVFEPFLRPVGGNERAWSNSLRAAKEAEREHKGVLRSLRALMDDLPANIRERNFAPAEYLDAQGKPRPMIEFSEDVLANVLGAVGGQKFHILLFRFQQEFNRLREAERRGSLGQRKDGLQIIAEQMAEQAKQAAQDRTVIMGGIKELAKMHIDANRQLIELILARPINVNSNVRSMDPERYRGVFRGLALIQRGIFVEAMAKEIAATIKLPWGPGNFTVHMFKDQLKKLKIVSIFENDTLPCGHIGTVPVPYPEYTEWFAFHDQVDTGAGNNPRWSWCLTDVGARELRKISHSFKGAA